MLHPMLGTINASSFCPESTVSKAVRRSAPAWQVPEICLNSKACQKNPMGLLRCHCFGIYV